MREPSPWLVVAVLLVAAGIGAVVLWRSPKADLSPPAPPPVAAELKPLPDALLPPVQTSDAKAQGLFGAVSARPDVQGWLKSGDLLNRFAVVIDNLAEGVTPRKQLAFLAPKQGFVAQAKGGKLVISQESYQRYDQVGDAVGSVDAQAFAKAVRELHPLLEATYHQLGYPGRKLDEVLAKAAQSVLDAPVVEGEVAVEKAGSLYFYADSKLEKLDPVEKHLLRMGPRNERLIQAKVREIAAALALPLGNSAGQAAKQALDPSNAIH